MSEENQNEPMRQHHRLAAGYPLQGMKDGGKTTHTPKHKAAPKAAPARKSAGRGR